MTTVGQAFEDHIDAFHGLLRNEPIGGMASTKLSLLHTATTEQKMTWVADNLVPVIDSLAWWDDGGEKIRDADDETLKEIFPEMASIFTRVNPSKRPRLERSVYCLVSLTIIAIDEEEGEG